MMCKRCATLHISGNPVHDTYDCYRYRNWWINRDAFNEELPGTHPTWFPV